MLKDTILKSSFLYCPGAIIIDFHVVFFHLVHRDCQHNKRTCSYHKLCSILLILSYTLQWGICALALSVLQHVSYIVFVHILSRPTGMYGSVLWSLAPKCISCLEIYYASSLLFTVNLIDEFFYVPLFAATTKQSEWVILHRKNGSYTAIGFAAAFSLIFSSSPSGK